MLTILNQLADEPSKNAKIQILKTIAASDQSGLFQKVVEAAYNPFIKYHIDKFDTHPDCGHYGTTTLAEAIDNLTDLSERKVTGNAAQTWMRDGLSLLSEDDAEVFARIVHRDLRAGFTSNTAAKVWKNLQFKHPYMRGSGFSEKLLKRFQKNKFFYTQLKSDGLYSDTVARDGTVECLARSGKVQSFTNPARDAAMLAEVGRTGEFVIMGEVLVRDENGDIMDRATSNGYMKRDDKDESRIFVSAWDMVPVKDWGPKRVCKIPYHERFDRLTRFIDENPGIGIERTEHRVCRSVQDVIDHFNEVRQRGEEGLMLKNPDMFWKDGTSTDMVKIKVVMDVDLKMIGWNEGKGKYVGQVGSIQCESDCGLVTVNVSGLKDDQRADVAGVEAMIKKGAILTCLTNGVVSSRSNPGKFSLYLPRLKEYRSDKFIADDLAKCQAQELAFTDAFKAMKKDA